MRILFCVLFYIVVGQQLVAAPPHKAGEITSETKSLKTRSGEVIDYELGTLYVLENRSDPDSRVIGVGFARLSAGEKVPGVPPVFRLPGGPGSSFLRRLKSARGRDLERWLPQTARLRKFCDVVIVDQRGFTEHGDVLIRKKRSPANFPDRSLTTLDYVTASKEFARETVEEYSKSEIDLRGYTVKECAHDVADLAKALGYEKVTLNGTSFGSQWSFAVMRLHPEIVARAVLSGVEPLDHSYDMPSYLFAGLQRIWRVVDRDDRFKPYLPEGGMAEAARVVIERLEREPIRLTGKDSESGKPTPQGVIGPDRFPYHEPKFILELYHGRTERWRQRSGASLARRSRDMNLIQPLIDTSLGVTPARRHQIWNDPANRYLRRRGFAGGLATAEIWPSPDVGDDFRTPILSDIPVVFAQGNWDINTPIENTFEIAQYFPNSRIIIADRGGHGVLEPIADQLPKVWAEIEEFVRNGDLQDIPVNVTLKPSHRFEPPTFKLPSK
jgi:pimeloyl-ACP methyl ester carboxylesterase